MSCTYDVVVGGVPQQAAEGDDGSEAGEVHEEEGGEALGVEGVGVVTQVPRHLPLHVRDQPSKQPAQHSTSTSPSHGVRPHLHFP